MARATPWAIETHQLRHSFGALSVLDGLDLRVASPGVHGFLGVNGAGKSTTMRILNGFLTPTSGQARVLGVRVGPQVLEVRHRLGYLPQQPAFHGWMTGMEVLLLAADLYGMDRRAARQQAGELLERLDLGKAAGRRVAGYSGGMKQRLGLAQALLPSPELLLLDEPVSALDPVGRMEVLDLIAHLGQRAAVFMSSHILADVERICDHVTILHQGRVVVNEASHHLRARFLRPVFELVLEGDTGALRQRLAALPFVERVESSAQAEDHTRPPPDTRCLRLWVTDADAARRQLPALLAASGLPLHHFGAVSADLESVFMRIVGHEEAS